MLFVVSTLTAQSYQTHIIDSDTIKYQYTPIDQNYANSRSSGRLAYKLFAGDPLAIMVLPIYTFETSAGLALSAKYIKPKFDVSATAIASLTGYYNISVVGNNKLQNRHNLDYGAQLRSEPTRLWGLSYDSAIGNHYNIYTSREYSAWIEYSYQLTKNTNFGLFIDYQHLGARKLDAGAQLLLSNKTLTISAASIGIDIGYDSRNNISHYQQRGIHTKAEVKYRPWILSNLNSNLWSLNAFFDWYQPLWADATLAFDLYGEYNSKNTPWLLLSKVGGDGRMRGYYLGRFRGTTLLSSQLELRQHIIKGFGAAIWYGAGTAFSPNDSFAWRKILPTYGVGLRYYHKLFMLRADAAFGRNSFNIILGISEAF